MKALTLCLISLVGIALSGCGPKDEMKTVYRPGESPVASVKDSDPEMNAARAKAASELPHFIAELGNPKGREFFIKVALNTADGGLEHIWADQVEYKDGKFKGKLANTPLDLPGRKMGDPVEATKENISDWMIMDGEKMEGGYTSKLLQERQEKS